MPKFTQPHHAANVFMVFLLCFNLCLGVLYVVILQAFDISFSPWFIIFTQVTGLLLPLGIWLAVTRDKLNLPRMELGSRNVLYVVLLSFLLQPGMMVVSGISGLIFPNQVAELFAELMENPLWLMLLAIAITPAICEEVVFRGYIQSKYKHWTIKCAALINGLFFAIIHLNAQQFFYAFVLGAIFAYLVHYTRSIYAGILAHFIMNASQIVIARASLRMLAAQEYVDADVTAGAVAFIGIVVIVATLGAVKVFRALVLHNIESIDN